MYTTLEVDIENGQISGADSINLPRKAHALLTLLRVPRTRRPNWSRIETQLGKLKLRENTVDWQRSVRSEWCS